MHHLALGEERACGGVDLAGLGVGGEIDLAECGGDARPDHCALQVPLRGVDDVGVETGGTPGEVDVECIECLRLGVEHVRLADRRRQSIGGSRRTSH
ncbi:Uncharacterised protein [Mycobacteroides abscessus subsp. abscessus]|nr:Uncharacterised protein [Mycobacteroides abscessus subsp. abscessus]